MALTRYRFLMNRLLLERAMAGGKLSQEEESRHVALLDEVWWQLTQLEQEQAEHDPKRRPPAPTTLELVDVEVTEGTGALPRVQLGT